MATAQFPELRSIWVHKLGDHSLPQPQGPQIFAPAFTRLWIPSSEWDLKPEFKSSQLSSLEFQISPDFYRLFGRLISCFQSNPTNF